MKKARKPELFQTEKLEQIKDFISVIQQGERQDILTTLIENGSMSVKELYSTLKIDQSAASIHLKQLKSIELVNTNKVSTNAFYSVNEENLKKSIVFINQIYDNLPK